MYDVIVVGGGPAGLQAALTLGRMHQSALLIDSGQYRNEAAHRMHNFATHDGTPPADFRAAARKEIAAYETVEIRDTVALAIDPVDGNFAVTLDGGDRVSAARIVLATGVRDVLPAIPGLEALWGTVVAHCPVLPRPRAERPHGGRAGWAERGQSRADAVRHRRPRGRHRGRLRARRSERRGAPRCGR